MKYRWFVAQSSSQSVNNKPLTTLGSFSLENFTVVCLVYGAYVHTCAWDLVSLCKCVCTAKPDRNHSYVLVLICYILGLLWRGGQNLVFGWIPFKIWSPRYLESLSGWYSLFVRRIQVQRKHQHFHSNSNNLVVITCTDICIYSLAFQSKVIQFTNRLWQKEHMLLKKSSLATKRCWECQLRHNPGRLKISSIRG